MKKEWTKPRLIVLTKEGSGEERVLAGCKTTGSFATSSGDNTGCAAKCTPCDAWGAS